MSERTRTEVEHRWFEYGRWFYGFGSSMDQHRCNYPGENLHCQWRTRTVTTTETATEWSDQKPVHLGPDGTEVNAP